jgi:predicted metal-dependent hydrolase
MGILRAEIKHSFAGPCFSERVAGLGFTFAEAIVTLAIVSKKSGRIAALIDGCRGRDLDPHYLGYFACFNQGLFYESHDVLEELWLADRQGPNGAFYKGLIQFAGAFVHLEKDSPARRRLRPAAALFKLARTNLARYPGIHERLDVSRVLALIEEWLGYLESGRFAVNPLSERAAPRLAVEGDGLP